MCDAKIEKLELSFLGKLLEKAFGVRPGNLGKLTRLDTEDNGYFAYIVSIELSWPPGHENLPSRVVVKIPTSDKIRAELAKGTVEYFDEDLIKVFHNNECNFYNLLSQRSPSAQWFRQKLAAPQSFYQKPMSNDAKGDQDVAVIMEDFSGQTESIDFLVGLNLEQMKQVIDNIAVMHAYSFAYHKEWSTWISPITSESFSRTFILPYLKDSATAVCSIPGFPFTLEQIDPILAKNVYWDTLTPGFPPVVVHSDLWTPNFLWQKGKLVAIIDWQFAHSGDPSSDLARLISINLAPDTRRANEAALLDYYYEKLGSFLAELGQKTPFARAQLDKGYQNAFKSVAIFGLIEMGTSLKRCESEEHSMCILSRAAGILEDILKLEKLI